MNAARELTPEILAAKIEEAAQISSSILALAKVIGECCESADGTESHYCPNNSDATTLSMLMVDLADKQGKILDIPGGWANRFKEERQ